MGERGTPPAGSKQTAPALGALKRPSTTRAAPPGGGALRFYDAETGTVPVAELIPETGMVVVFPGTLTHAVVANTAASPRVSVAFKRPVLPSRRDGLRPGEWTLPSQSELGSGDRRGEQRAW